MSDSAVSFFAADRAAGPEMATCHVTSLPGCRNKYASRLRLSPDDDRSAHGPVVITGADTLRRQPNCCRATVCDMTDAFTMPTREDAKYVHDEWDRRTRAHDIDGLLELYLPDATLESPLVPRVLDQLSGVLRGHDELRHFFVRGTEGRPNDLVRWYRTGEFMFDKRTLIWEYPRQAPDWEQVDLVEVMELSGPRIAHHRIYWGWYGTPLLQPSR